MAGTRFSRGFQRVNPQPPAFFSKHVDRCVHLFLFYTGISTRRFHNRIAEHADAFDFNLDHIARVHRLRCAGSTRIDDVARHQRHKLADIADNGIDGENQFTSAA